MNEEYIYHLTDLSELYDYYKFINTINFNEFIELFKNAVDIIVKYEF